MLTLTPVALATANAFVNSHHRHHKATAGHKFSIGCAKDGELVGSAKDFIALSSTSIILSACIVAIE